MQKEKRHYTKTDKLEKAVQKVVETHTPKGINRIYWEDFEKNSGKTGLSLAQYKNAINRFTSVIEKDILTISKSDLENYISDIQNETTRKNAERYIKSFITFTIEYDMNRAVEVVSDELLFDLIPSEYWNLIKILIKKNIKEGF